MNKAIKLFVISGLVLLSSQAVFDVQIIQPAHAVIGRPMTPGSVAGVSRRTTRRTVRRHSAVAVGTAVAIGTTIAVLPTSCTTVVSASVTYHSCGGVYYKPVYHGTTLNYVVVNQP